MAGYNRIIIMGNLTRDPEYKQLTSGQSVCRLGLASNRQFKNRQTGLAVQEVCFVDVDVWGAQAESCQQYLQKGRAVLVEGRLKLDSWQDNDGQKRNKHLIVADRVVFLSVATQVDTGSSVVDKTTLAESEFEKMERSEPETVGVSPNLDSVTPAVPQPVKTENKKDLEPLTTGSLRQVQGGPERSSRAEPFEKLRTEQEVTNVAPEEKTKQVVEEEKKSEKLDQFGSGEVNFTDQKPFEDDLPF